MAALSHVCPAAPYWTKSTIVPDECVVELNNTTLAEVLLILLPSAPV
jgi:hypothetical protein